MPEVEFHLHNEAGIKFPPLRPAYSDGDLFFGRFRALIARTTGTSVIGEGGTGLIHLVRDELMDREVALKIPLESILRDPAAREDVIQETRQAMELTHPNIVRIHDFHESDRLWGISMQQVRGKNLDEWRYDTASTTGTRRTIRPYTVDKIRDWIAQLCDALRYAHEDARMVHRDIKPKNLMLEQRDGGSKLLLTDFGITQRLRMHNMMLSRDQDRAGEAKSNMGTLPYMPWEQIAGGQPSPLDDVYAVGATIYELITGRPPFYEGSFEQIKIQIKETAPPSMEERLSQFGIHSAPIPNEWENTVAACLAKRPEDRPQSMRELISALGFHAGNDTKLEALVQSQQDRIQQLESRIEVIGTPASGDPKWENQARALQQEVESLRTALASSDTSGETEARIADLTGQLEQARQNLADFQAEQDARLQTVREEAAAEIARLQQENANAGADVAAGFQEKIQNLETALTRSREDAGAELQAKVSELEARLQSSRDEASAEISRLQSASAEANEAAAAGFQEKIQSLEAALARSHEEAGQKTEAETASLRQQAESLQEKLHQAEQAREQAISAVREEAEKRLQSQAADLHKARQTIEKTSQKNEELDRLVAVEKNRQSASLRPLLLILLCSLLLGLAGGFAASKFRSSSPSVAIPQMSPGDIAAAPVSHADFLQFAKAMGFPDASPLLLQGTKPGSDGEVLGVNAHVARQYCDWLTQIARANGGIRADQAFTLPSLDDLKSKAQSGKSWIEWTSDREGIDLIIFRHGNPGDPALAVPPVTADPNRTFRIKLTTP